MTRREVLSRGRTSSKLVGHPHSFAAEAHSHFISPACMSLGVHFASQARTLWPPPVPEELLQELTSATG